MYVGGIQANEEVITGVWQYSQLIPLPSICRLWLNGTT